MNETCIKWLEIVLNYVTKDVPCRIFKFSNDANLENNQLHPCLVDICIHTLQSEITVICLK